MPGRYCEITLTTVVDMYKNPQIILASASPRRSELLQQLGIAHEVLPVDIDESHRLDESPEALVQRLALEKAYAGMQRSGTRLPVLGSDTIVVIHDRILGKPKNRADGLAILHALSGHTHQVLSAVALVNDERSEVALNISRVSFCDLTDEQILAYWNTGEPADKAGGYGIQGIGAQFIKHLDGSYSGVMGLPLMETAQLLNRFGVATLQRP